MRAKCHRGGCHTMREIGDNLAGDITGEEGGWRWQQGGESTGKLTRGARGVVILKTFS